MSDLKALYDAIVDGNAGKAKSITQTALDENVDPQEILNKYMIPAMDEVGRRFETNEYFVPELLIAARAMKGASLNFPMSDKLKELIKTPSDAPAEAYNRK